MTIIPDQLQSDIGGGNSGPGWPMRSTGGWRCPPWCNGRHEAGRHAANVETLHLTGNPDTPEVVAVNLVERLGGYVRVELVRDTGDVLNPLDTLGLSIDEAMRLHRALTQALVEAGRVSPSQWRAS